MVRHREKRREGGREGGREEANKTESWEGDKFVYEYVKRVYIYIPIINAFI